MEGGEGDIKNYKICDVMVCQNNNANLVVTFQAFSLVIVKGFSLPRNPEELSSNVSLLPPLKGVK